MKSAILVRISLATHRKEQGNFVADTTSVVRTLRTAGIPTMFETTAGTHFAPAYPRIEKVFGGLTQLATQKKMC